MFRAYSVALSFNSWAFNLNSALVIFLRKRKINNNQKLEVLITNLPLIKELKSSLTYGEIVKVLEKNFNIKLTSQEIINFINRLSLKHKEFDNLVLLSEVSRIEELENFAIEFHKLFVVHKSIMNMLPEVDFEEIMITSNNLIKLLEPEAMIYSKRILRLYDIPDELLIQQQDELLTVQPINLTQMQNDIHHNFHNEAKKLMKDVIQNYVTFLTQNLAKVYKKEASLKN
jgi:hypothetical protein